MTYTSLESKIRRVLEAKEPRAGESMPFHKEKDQNDQIVIGTYTTQSFEMSHEAQMLYAELPKDTEVNYAEQAAINLDKLFDLEKTVATQDRSTQSDVSRAEHLQAIIMHQAQKARLEKQHSFVQKHVDNIRSKLSKAKPQHEFIEPEDHVHPTDDPRFASPPKSNNPDPIKGPQGDRDIDNIKRYLIKRNQKAQRKIKLIDVD